jgi:hypothetical protein
LAHYRAAHDNHDVSKSPMSGFEIPANRFFVEALGWLQRCRSLDARGKIGAEAHGPSPSSNVTPGHDCATRRWGANDTDNISWRCPFFCTTFGANQTQTAAGACPMID